MEEELAKADWPSGIGIGHSRWASHGQPSDANAHPHTDCSGHFMIVHNGIIENFRELRAELKAKGHRFTSETDTEVIPHLIEELYAGDLEQAFQGAIERLRGEMCIRDRCNEELGMGVGPCWIGYGRHWCKLAC